MLTRCQVFAGAAAAALASFSLAQERGGSPLSGATEPGADKPATLIAESRHADPEIERLLTLLCGSFRADAREGDASRPVLRYNAARITVQGLDNAVYFEVAREDSPLAPFRQGVFHIFHSGKELRLRVLEFRQGPSFAQAVAGLWAAPEAIPAMGVESLGANLDLVVSTTDKGAVARTAHAFPTTVGGAVEVMSTVELGADRIALHDIGYDADGGEVWGGGQTGKAEFKRQPQPWFTRLGAADGLVIIQVRPPEAGAAKVAENGELAMHFTGWLTDGMRFNSTRAQGAAASKVRLPMSRSGIKGWSDGLAGIAVGEWRKIVVPPNLAFGDRGAGGGLVPPNATLIFESECVFVDNSAAGMEAPAGVNPHGH